MGAFCTLFYNPPTFSFDLLLLLYSVHFDVALSMELPWVSRFFFSGLAHLVYMVEHLPQEIPFFRFLPLFMLLLSKFSVSPAVLGHLVPFMTFYEIMTSDDFGFKVKIMVPSVWSCTFLYLVRFFLSKISSPSHAAAAIFPLVCYWSCRDRKFSVLACLAVLYQFPLAGAGTPPLLRVSLPLCPTSISVLSPITSPVVFSGNSFLSPGP